MPKCGDPHAHRLFCVNEPTGTGLWSMLIAYVVVFWACIRSVAAIESQGGDDDRQLLSFWIIYIIILTIENVSDVLLSWMPTYYEVCVPF